MDSRCLTKIQSAVLVAIILLVSISGIVAYVLFLDGQSQSTETIKIGVLGDLDNPVGRHAWQAAVLAAEQVNAEGGVLGLEFEIVAEDDDSTESRDVTVSNNALLRLITVDQADFILDFGLIIAPHQDICYDHKKILFSIGPADEMLTQRVLDDYDKYKYYFRGGVANETQIALGNINGLLTLIEYTGFNKVALLFVDFPAIDNTRSIMSNALIDEGVEIVYSNSFSMGVIDYTSYFLAIEEAGAEIICYFEPSALAFVNEWYQRQFPAVLWGSSTWIQDLAFWKQTEGRCESVSAYANPITCGYPLTSKTLSTRESYLARWGEVPTLLAGVSHDVVRFIIPAALEKAKTTQVDAVIEALETIDVETSSAHHFIFTSSHDIMHGEKVDDPEEGYPMSMAFQWQNGEMVPVYPKKIMEEAGATYKFPPWPGPWE